MKQHMLLTCLAICVAIHSVDAYAVDLLPMQVGTVYEYIKYNYRTPENTWTPRIEVLSKVTIESHEYSNLKISDIDPDEVSYLIFRSDEDTVYFYGDETERAIWRKAAIGTTWSYFDVDGVGTTHAEIVSADSLPWEADKDTLTVPYGEYSFDNVYIHKKYYGDDTDEFWYEYLVPGVGVVKDVDDENPPHIMELVPEPGSSTLLLVSGATLGLLRLRKRKQPQRSENHR